MATRADYAGNFMRWKSGRQETGYEKMLLVANPFILPFDCYLLRYKQGTGVPQHTDPVDSKRHYRLNVVLKKAKAGGEFSCDNPIYESNRVKLFRPDQSPHSVTPVEKGVRYVLSVGWVRK
jgi:hypothetical protein